MPSDGQFYEYSNASQWVSLYTLNSHMGRGEPSRPSGVTLVGVQITITYFIADIYNIFDNRNLRCTVSRTNRTIQVKVWLHLMYIYKSVGGGGMDICKLLGYL